MPLVQHGWTAESAKQLIEDTVAEVRRRYPDDILTEEVGGFILGYTAGRGFPEDISDAVLVCLVARPEDISDAVLVSLVARP